MLNINTTSKILNGMDHPLSLDQMGGLDSCELVTKVMSDLRLCNHSFCTSLGSLVCWKLTTPAGWLILASLYGLVCYQPQHKIFHIL